MMRMSLTGKMGMPTKQTNDANESKPALKTQPQGASVPARHGCRAFVSLDAIKEGELKMKKQNIRFRSLLVGIGCFMFLARMPAVFPPPDGGYPGFNTPEGTNAPFYPTTRSSN